jgi:predicted ATPase
MRRAVITGAPGAGKSALIDALGMLGVVTHQEVARAILQQEGGMAMRADDPLGFAEAMFAAQMAFYQRCGDAEVVVLDRAFADIVGFLDISGLPVPAHIDRACRELRFEGPVFHARPWRAIYVGDSERIQDWDEAVESDRAVIAAWRRYGYALVELPFVPVKERAEFVLERLGGAA